MALAEQLIVLDNTMEADYLKMAESDIIVNDTSVNFLQIVFVVTFLNIE